ncbi:MAG: stage sporulation protein [Actinomycetota bacterium]
MFWGLCALVLGLAPARVATAATPPGWVTDRVRFEPVDGPLSVAGTGDYRGVIELRAAGRAVAVVNEVGLDDYVKGISEVPVRWPIEAQKAQAIAARTYALYQMAHRPASAVADICPTQSCQVYAGLAKEQRDGGQAWTAAVEATAGQVLLWKGGPINAKYSSTNGGRTVGGGQPYLRSVADPDDAQSPYHRWRVTLPLDILAGLFAPPGPLVAVQRIGDNVAFDWTDPDGGTGQMLVPAAAFRERVNGAMPAPAGLPLTLPSIRFTLVSDASGAVADGQGWGHGVGMSQYGALGKALRGMKAPEILASYYAGLKPVTMAAGQLPASIRVMLDPGRASAVVGSGGRFRVVDGAGNVIALAGRGDWQVVPAGAGKVRVVPPADQAGPPGVTSARLEQSSPQLGQATRLLFGLSSPATVQVAVQLPGQPPTTVDLGLRDPGEQAVDVPAALTPGAGQVVINADAGGGRTAVVPVGFAVVPAPPPPPRPRPARLAAVERLVPSASLDAWIELGALALLMLVSTGVVRLRRQLH